MVKDKLLFTKRAIENTTLFIASQLSGGSRDMVRGQLRDVVHSWVKRYQVRVILSFKKSIIDLLLCHQQFLSKTKIRTYQQ